MAVEIERKFLVIGQPWLQVPGVVFRQGYLNRDKARTVRVRVAGEAAFLTIKGVSVGATRAEFEYPIPLADAEALLALCEGPLIEKTRHVLTHAGMAWELDVFAGDNAGLVVAEIELQREDEPFEKPAWAGADVTDQSRYYNLVLAARPYAQWTPAERGEA